jgi:hypothetical protein
MLELGREYNSFNPRLVQTMAVIIAPCSDDIILITVFKTKMWVGGKIFEEKF